MFLIVYSKKKKKKKKVMILFREVIAGKLKYVKIIINKLVIESDIGNQLKDSLIILTLFLTR